MCYGLALMGIEDHAVWEDALLPRSHALAATLDQHSLTNVIWSLGTLQLRPSGDVLSELLAQAVALIELHEDSSEASRLLPKPEHKGNVATELKSPKPSDASRAHLSSSSSSSSSRLTPQFFANITWSLTRLQHHDMPFMRRVEALFPRLADAATAQNIANVLWAFSSLEFPSKRLFAELRPKVEQIVLDQARGLSPQALSNIAWSYAKAGQVRCSWTAVTT
jgi:hypothetical protein